MNHRYMLSSGLSFGTIWKNSKLLSWQIGMFIADMCIFFIILLWNDNPSSTSVFIALSVVLAFTLVFAVSRPKAKESKAFNTRLSALAAIYASAMGPAIVFLASAFAFDLIWAIWVGVIISLFFSLQVIRSIEKFAKSLKIWGSEVQSIGGKIYLVMVSQVVINFMIFLVAIKLLVIEKL